MSAEGELITLGGRLSTVAKFLAPCTLQQDPDKLGNALLPLSVLPLSVLPLSADLSSMCKSDRSAMTQGGIIIIHHLASIWLPYGFHMASAFVHTSLTCNQQALAFKGPEKARDSIKMRRPLSANTT